MLTCVFCDEPIVGRPFNAQRVDGILYPFCSPLHRTTMEAVWKPVKVRSEEAIREAREAYQPWMDGDE